VARSSRSHIPSGEIVLRDECIELIGGTGGYQAAVEPAAQALGISQTQARRWVHSLGASTSTEVPTAPTRPASGE
jgi:transposase-like protein